MSSYITYEQAVELAQKLGVRVPTRSQYEANVPKRLPDSITEQNIMSRLHFNWFGATVWLVLIVALAVTR